MLNDKAKAVINRLDADPKKGEPYNTGRGKGGFRNPIRSDTGLVLYNIIRARQAYAAIEFGTADGLSGCFIGSALEKGGVLHTIEFNAPTAVKAQANLDEAMEGQGVGVGVLNGDALEMVRQLVEGNSRIKYDVVFLDAQKDQYREYIVALQEGKLLKPNCLVIADNVMDREEEARPFLEYMTQYNNVVIPVGQSEGMPTAGLSIAIIP